MNSYGMEITWNRAFSVEQPGALGTSKFVKPVAFSGSGRDVHLEGKQLTESHMHTLRVSCNSLRVSSCTSHHRTRKRRNNKRKGRISFQRIQTEVIRYLVKGKIDKTDDKVGHYLQNLQATDIYMLECLIPAWPVKTIRL